MLGPVKRATSSARISFPKREITSQPHYGEIIDVEVPTHVTGILEFGNGAIGTLLTSFDMWPAGLPHMEIYGTLGTLSVPDPNTFGGPVRIRRAGASEWSEIPLSHGYSQNSRGLGTADMAHASRSGRPHRASGELAFHVLDIMHTMHESSAQGRHIELQSTCARPKPLPMGLRHGLLDE